MSDVIDPSIASNGQGTSSTPSPDGAASANDSGLKPLIDFNVDSTLKEKSQDNDSGTNVEVEIRSRRLAEVAESLSKNRDVLTDKEKAGLFEEKDKLQQEISDLKNEHETNFTAGILREGLSRYLKDNGMETLNKYVETLEDKDEFEAFIEVVNEVAKFAKAGKLSGNPSNAVAGADGVIPSNPNDASKADAATKEKMVDQFLGNFFSGKQ